MSNEKPGNVVIIAEAEGIVIKGIERQLSQKNMKVSFAGKSVDNIKALKDEADIYLIVLSDKVASLFNELIYINDCIRDTTTEVAIIGEGNQRESFFLDVPDFKGKKWFDRPVDNDKVIAYIEEAITEKRTKEKRKRILIVDDDPVFARMIREWLKSFYQVYIVSGGMQALTFLSKSGIDLILLDYEMPVVDGPQILEMLRTDEENAKIPVVFLTGISSKESVSRVIALKPDGYLLKSTGRTEFLDYLRNFFKNRQA